MQKSAKAFAGAASAAANIHSDNFVAAASFGMKNQKGRKSKKA